MKYKNDVLGVAVNERIVELRKYRLIKVLESSGCFIGEDEIRGGREGRCEEVYSNSYDRSEIIIKGVEIIVMVKGKIVIKDRGVEEVWYSVECNGDKGYCKSVVEGSGPGFEINIVEGEMKTFQKITKIHHMQEFESEGVDIEGEVYVIAEGRWRGRRRGLDDVTWYYVRNEEEQGWVWERKIF